MKHLCVIQLINSTVRSCGRSLREPVISQCRKGQNQSTVSELFYHTFATDFIIQGDVLLSEAPLCKGSCREATEGLSRKHHRSTEIPSESCQSLRPAGTSLYTREAWSEYNLAYSPGPGCNGNLTPPGSRGRLPLREGVGCSEKEKDYPFLLPIG